MAGLIILIIIVCMAVFAPLLTPYSTEFTAPITDTFLGDEREIPISSKNVIYDAPLGIQTQASFSGGSNLSRILVYSRNGTVITYPVSVGVQSKIIIGEPAEYPVPSNISYLKFVQLSYNLGRYFIVADEKLIITDVSFKILESYNLSFRPRYYSELWNAYSLSAASAAITIFAAADEKNVALYSIVAHTEIPGSRPVPTPYFSVHSFNETADNLINAPPLLLFMPGEHYYPNGTMMVISRHLMIQAYNITADVQQRFGKFEYHNARLGEMIWQSNLTINGFRYHNIRKGSPIFPYPSSNQLGFGKDRIIAATEEGYNLAFSRANGTLLWKQKLFFNSATYKDYKVSSLYPSERAGTSQAEILIAADIGERNCLLATLNVNNGLVNGNGTRFIQLEGRINTDPSYVLGLKYYLVSTDSGNIYILTEFMNRTASFSIRGGARTPAVFLGNIVELRSITGNYFGVISNTNTLFVESLTGINIAPLAPGRYSSGNYYMLGTDDAGHDIFTWLIYGARSELAVGITAALVATVIGTFVGIIAGYFGGAADMVVSGFVDVLLCLPGLVILLILASIMGPSIFTIILLVGVLGWPGITRVIRSVVLSLKERAYMDSARVTGASGTRIVFIHLLPNVMPYAFFYMAIGVSGAIVTEAALAFLGFGDPNAVTWGMMLQYFRTSGVSITGAWWWLFPPGIMITLLSLSFYLIGRGFDAILNPKLRER